MSELQLRIISAAILAPLALAALWFGGWPFAAMIALGVALMLMEWRTIIGAAEPAVFRLAAMAALAVAVLVAHAWRVEAGVVLLLAPLALVAAEIARGDNSDKPRLLVAGVLYAGIPGLAAVALRDGHAGGAAIGFIFAVVWATDIGAYFAGRAIGGPKLWPRVSPKKTWSGAIGGLIAAVVTSGLFLWAVGAGPAPQALLHAAILSVASQGGDLFESSLKRRFGVKDSGHIIPGHGGILDRVDGLVAALALAWLIGALFALTDASTGILALKK